MSARRRAGTWQDEVARSFSRLFSRTSSQEKEEESAKDPGEEQDRGDRSLSRLFFRSLSQEKKDGSDRTEQGEEQERSHSPSRLFFRKISQEGKGGTENVSPARGSREEQDRSRGFSRLFTRTSSQEREEENDSSRGAREDQSRHEDNRSALTADRDEAPSSAEPEQVTLDQTSSPPIHHISEEEKSGELAFNSKVLDSERQSRENFFHFIGNLFHFSPKSSLGTSKQAAGVPEPSKEHEDAQVINNLDKEHLDQESTGEDQRGAEEPSEQHTARQEQEDLGVSGGGDPKGVLEGREEAATDTPKLNGHAEDAPAITYGTYRGSRRIRKLLKRRADVNSPILEKEETPETCFAGDAPTESSLMLHDWENMEPVPDRNCQDEIPPSKIQIKMQSKFDHFDQSSKLPNDDIMIQKAKDSRLTNGLEKDKDQPLGSNNDVEKSSEVIEEQHTKNEKYVSDVPKPNAQESSEVLQPNTGESFEDLQPTLGGSLNISGHLEQNVENSEVHSLEITISNNLEPNKKRHHADIEPKTVDISDTVRDLQPNTDETPKVLQPNFKESIRLAEILQASLDDDSKIETDLSPKGAGNVNILPNAKETGKDHQLEHEHANTQKYGTFSEMNNLQSEAKDTLVRTEELEENSKENTKASVDLGNCLDANMLNASPQSHLELALDSRSCSDNQQAVQVNLNLEEKPHKDPSNLHPTMHNRSDRSSDENCDASKPLTSDCLKPEIEKRSDNVPLQPNAQLVSSSTVDIEPNTMGNSVIREQLLLNGEEYSNQPNWELNSTLFNKKLSETEDIPNLHLQLNANTDDLQQIENIKHLQTNTNPIPESDEDLQKTKLQPDTKVSFHLKEKNNMFLEKTPLQSGDIPNLELQPIETSSTSKDLKEIANKEHLPTNAKTIPEDDPQKDVKLLQSNTKVAFQLQESSDQSLLKSGIISKMMENRRPNLHIMSHVSDGKQAEEPSKDNLCLKPNSEIHVPEKSNDSLVDKVSQKHEFVSDEGSTETSHSNCLDNEDIRHVDQPDGPLKELDIKPAISYDNPDNMAVQESCLDDGSSFKKDHEAVTSRNISFDNGIECRSPSPITMSGSTSYVDCNDVQFDSPNDSGIVSSQAYTPDEHTQSKTFPSEILLKNIPDLFAVDQNSEDASAPEHDGSVSVAIVQNKEPVIKINGVAEEETGSLVDGCTSNSGGDDYIITSTPDKLVNSNSDVYVAKVSMKTVNIEEVKLSPYGLCSDIISVAKLESPTFTKKVICLPNLSPPEDTENAFQFFHSVTDHKDLNKQLPNHQGEYLTMNKCEKHQKNCYLETDEVPSNKDNDVTMNLVSDLPDNDNIPQYTCMEKESPNSTDKSPDVLIENLKNNNINVCTSDNIINVSLQAHKSEGLMSSDSLKELRLGESLSELNPDSRMNHREKLSDLLLHSALLHDVTDTNDIISSCSTTAKIILPIKDHSQSSNELFEQKANEIIFSVLHSAIDELQNINQSHRLVSVNHHAIPDIKHEKETLSEHQVDLEDHPAEVLAKCPGKPSDHILLEDSDLIVSMAVGIVNDVISSSKQVVVSNMITNGLSKDVTTQQKPPSDFNGIFTEKRNDPVEDTTNSNYVLPSLCYDNVIHLPPCEINFNVLPLTTEVSQNIESRKANEPNSSDELGSRVTEDLSEINEESNKTEHEEHLCFSRSSIKADTYNFINKSYANGELTLDDMYCGRQSESKSLGTEGSMEDLIYNNRCDESSNSSGFTDFLQFSVYNSRYVEISGSDEESTDEEKESGSEQVSGYESLLPVQSRRVRIYPYALSPIYEDDSAGEDTLSNNSSPKYNQGASASNGGHDHSSILSLLQSVSDRLKEADLEEERFSSLSNEASGVNDRFNREGSGELEDIICPSKTSLDEPSSLDVDKVSLGARSALFMTKSFTDNKPNLFSSRQSLLLNLISCSNVYGAKASIESNSDPSFRSEGSLSPTAISHQSTDPSPSTATVNSLAAENALPVHSSARDHKPRASPKSVYYQYYNAAQNYLSHVEGNECPAQDKPKESRKMAEPDGNPVDSDSLKFNPRPGKVILSDIIDRENNTELKADVPDATFLVFPNGVNIRVIRGCWILYEKPHFEGQAHVLEEGEAELRHLWDLSGLSAKSDRITIGSVKRVVKDYLPEVVISSLQDESDSPIYIRTEVPSLENLVGKHPRSLGVNSGVWLAYTEPQYNGAVRVLEEGSELCWIQDSGVKSMRALKMGGLKVQLPSDPRIIVYEKPHFQGRSREITEHVGSIGAFTGDGDHSASPVIGSIQVMGGIWVGYENERYKGHQYLLEEGDYADWLAWGGYNNTIQSVRYLQADFLEPSVILYETDEEDEKKISLFNQAIPDLELAGYNTRMQCIHVTKGMWVAYQQKHFCGEQYVLEKGRYKTYVDWGGSNNTIMSIRPVLLEPLGRDDAKHSVKVYSRQEFQGEALEFTQSVCGFTSFMPMSIKVFRGCWLLSYEADSGDNLCVLEEGHFPDLASCGCPAAEIRSIRPIDYVFAEPSISLFALESCEGRELHFEDAVTSVLTKDLHFYAQSVWVKRGLWIAFEGANFLGRQMLLDPQQILNWSQFSGWKAIGSLRPVKQPSVYFMVKNRQKDKYLTTTGELSDSKATFVSVSPRNGQTTQIWYFCRGFLKSKVNDFCLDVIGGKNHPGSKVSLWAEHGKTRQKWKINSDGTIASHISNDLVLDLRGGNYYDQNYLVVNKVQADSETQKWDIEIL